MTEYRYPPWTHAPCEECGVEGLASRSAPKKVYVCSECAVRLRAVDATGKSVFVVGPYERWHTLIDLDTLRSLGCVEDVGTDGVWWWRMYDATGEHGLSYEYPAQGRHPDRGAAMRALVAVVDESETGGGVAEDSSEESS